MKANELNHRMLARREEELRLWFEKRRLLVKRISQLVQDLSPKDELLTKMADAEKKIADLSGMNRPLGPDSDEGQGR